FYTSASNLNELGNFSVRTGLSQFNAGTGSITLSGSSKTLSQKDCNSGGPNFGNLNITGTISSTGAGIICMTSTMTISGNLTLNNDLWATSGSTVTLSGAGTIAGNSTLNIWGRTVLGNGGTIT